MSLKRRLRRVEKGLQRAIEDNAARWLVTPDQASILAANLVSAIAKHLDHTKDAAHLVPGRYTLRLGPLNAESLRIDQEMFKMLPKLFVEEAEAAGIRVPAAPAFTIVEDKTLNLGEVRVEAQIEPETIDVTSTVHTESEPSAESIPQNAFLIVGGSKVFPLDNPVLNIGRRLDNHLVIDDPRVSRVHAQLRAIKDHFVLFDLGSTGGTYVNGVRIHQSVLYPGDVISLAGFSLVYGQDAPRSLDESKGYTRPLAVDQNKTITREDFKRD